MPFSDLTAAQRAFLATHTRSGQALQQAAKSAPVDPLNDAREIWQNNMSSLRIQIEAAPPALDTTKLIAALDQTERVFSADFDPNKAQSALNKIQAAFSKAVTNVTGETKDTGARLARIKSTFAELLKLAFPEKKEIGTKISDTLAQAQSEIDTGEFAAAERLLDEAEAAITGARVGVDAKAAKDLKPADLKVLMKTKDGRAQLDAIVDNLTDDVPPNVMMSILEARFSIDRRLFTNTADRENSMLDKAKHGAMLDTDSPKLKKFYKKLMDKQKAEEDQAD